MGTFCRHCGARLTQPLAKFCATCGKPQAVDSEMVVEQTAVSAKLIVQQIGRPPQTYPLGQQPIIIGRDPSSQICIDEPFISRRHAQLTPQGISYQLSDLDSTNGLTVNGYPVKSHSLQDGEIVRIGDQQGNSISLTFEQANGQQKRPYTGTMRLGQLQIGQQTTITIGRDPANILHLDHPTISRFHAEVRHTPTGPTIRDLGSANYTIVNGQTIRRPLPLHDGDVVQIGPYKLVYNQGRLDQFGTRSYRIDACELNRIVTVGNVIDTILQRRMQKQILNGVSLSIQPKEFVALVGGSGAGKSTLMKALSGFEPAMGQVLVNGDDLYTNMPTYRTVLGYVPQDDIIHHHLTVRSALTYAAQLRLPDASEQDIETRITKVLKEVELSNHLDKRVDQLSGGQRKRVSIASELLAEPGLFYLDEPTSGLDPGLEKKMMYNLRQLADAGRTIVLVTHATANIDQCTQVAFLGVGGYLAYYGPPHEARDFFGATDFADIYTRLSEEQPVDPATLPLQWQSAYQEMVAAGKTPTPAEFWAACFKQSPQYKTYVEDRSAQVPPPAPPQNQIKKSPERQRADLIKQFTILARRYFELISRDAISLGVLIAAMPVIAVLLLAMTGPSDMRGLEPGRHKDGDGCPRQMASSDAGTIYEFIQCDLEEAKNERRDGPFQGMYVVVGDTQRLLFVMALAPTLLGIFAASYEITKEAPIYQRERLVNLKIWPYLLSKTSVLTIFALVQCLLFLLVIGFRIDFPREGIFLPSGLEMYVTLVLATVASLSLGLLISAAVPSREIVIYIILVVLFIQILFSGAIFGIPKGARWLSWLTITRWSLEGLGSTADMERLRDMGGGCIEPEGLEDTPEDRRFPEADEFCEAGQTYLPPQYEFHINYRSSFWHLATVWLILLGFAAGFHGLAYVMQKRKDILK